MRKVSGMRVLVAGLVALAAWLVSSVALAGTVLVLGDSISAGYGVPAAKGWVKLLGERIGDAGYDYAVVNASVSGDTTAGALSRLPAALRQHRPDIVIVGIGGNDGLRGLRLKNTRENLVQIVKLSRKAGAQVLLLGMDLPPSQGAKYVRDFRDMYPAVARATGATFLPGFLVKVGTDPDMMQSDGIHPNTLGQPVLVDTVWPALLPMLSR